ncbi:hypothetical protein LSH36_1520g00018 [Paralvinella palmiformis]|uniref:Uncharacterized protein n=1 Tax=Paralvinella palmiformis TaxID=53620 RepID=A0AAD9ITI3_9ANNE|nr:hypothetical protein LSH36_1520g00018 [Paralvinella palmiformis]
MKLLVKRKHTDILWTAETHCQYNRDFLGRYFSCRDFPDSEFRNVEEDGAPSLG